MAKHDLVKSLLTSQYSSQSSFDPSRKTAAALAHEAAAHTETYLLHEVSSLYQKDYMNDIQEAVEINRKRFPDNFFIEVRHNRDLPQINALHDRTIGRLTCPKPHFNQDLYFYDKKNEELHFLWSLPDRVWSKFLMNNPLFFGGVPAQILKYIAAYFDGSLYRHMKKLNREPYSGDTGNIVYKKDDPIEFTKTNKLISTESDKS